MTQAGDVLHSFSKDSSGQELFVYPCNLTMSPDHTMIYVSDFNEDSVTCLDIGGHVQAVYKDSRLTGPRGVVCDDVGNVYICSAGNDVIHVISRRCERGKSLLY